MSKSYVALFSIHAAHPAGRQQHLISLLRLRGSTTFILAHSTISFLHIYLFSHRHSCTDLHQHVHGKHKRKHFPLNYYSFIIYLAYLATGQSQQSPQEEFVLDFGHF